MAKSELLREFTAYITEYKEAAGVKKPTLEIGSFATNKYDSFTVLRDTKGG